MLTGKTRYRAGWLGHLILQVEIECREPDLSVRLSPGVDRMRTVKRWRDARVEDLITHPRAGISPDTVERLRREFLGVRDKLGMIEGPPAE